MSESLWPQGRFLELIGSGKATPWEMSFLVRRGEGRMRLLRYLLEEGSLGSEEEVESWLSLVERRMDQGEGILDEAHWATPRREEGPLVGRGELDEMWELVKKERPLFVKGPLGSRMGRCTRCEKRYLPN